MADEKKRSGRRREANAKKSRLTIELEKLEKLEHDFEVTDPEEVEARLRRMFYGRPVD
ncbi:MAG: hypothetical protein HKN07_12830 [Acidimicrobiia bacterium]|nr:hypothetical protein [Acidimicrobiia bacterium]